MVCDLKRGKKKRGLLSHPLPGKKGASVPIRIGAGVEEKRERVLSSLLGEKNQDPVYLAGEGKFIFYLEGGEKKAGRWKKKGFFFLRGPPTSLCGRERAREFLLK